VIKKEKRKNKKFAIKHTIKVTKLIKLWIIISVKPTPISLRSFIFLFIGILFNF
jgi:hypothetical protein